MSAPRKHLIRRPHRAAAISALALGLFGAVAQAADYSKLNEQGVRLSANASSWACVADAESGLVWENKANDSSLRDVNNTYSWLASDGANRGSYDEKDGGSCTGDISCDTAGFVRAVNRARLCGFNDWRVPTRRELQSLRKPSSKMPMIDGDYFPNTWESVYWASTGDNQRAHSVDFGDGFDYINRHSRAKYLRLVRGGK